MLLSILIIVLFIIIAVLSSIIITGRGNKSYHEKVSTWLWLLGTNILFGCLFDIWFMLELEDWVLHMFLGASQGFLIGGGINGVVGKTLNDNKKKKKE